jgi:hypothetical protein
MSENESEEGARGWVCSTGEMRNIRKILVEITEKKEHFENLSVVERIILKCILGKWGVKLWTGFN